MSSHRPPGIDESFTTAFSFADEDLFADEDRQISAAWIEEHWDGLDRELARSLVRRAVRRASKERPITPCDEFAVTLHKVRSTLSTMAYELVDAAAMGMCSAQARNVSFVSHAYLWCIRIAHELEGIEAAQLDAISDWERLERFAPFAVATYEATVANVAGPRAGVAEDALEELRRMFGIARRSSTLAA